MKLPLKLKAILMIVMICLLNTVAGVFVYYQGINSIITKGYEIRSVDITSALAEMIDADQVKTLRDDVCAIFEKEDKVIQSDQWGTPEFEEYL